MTKARPAAAIGGADGTASPVLQEIVRRSGHEIRNALSGVAVNVEVVRARAAKGSGSADIDSFADRASEQIQVANALTNALLSLLRAALSVQPADTPGATNAGAESQMELMIYGDEAEVLVSDIKPLAERIGLDVGQRDRSVILKVSPRDRSHSKE